MVACALVASRLDYANIVLYGTTAAKTFSKLQQEGGAVAGNHRAMLGTCSKNVHLLRQHSEWKEH